MRPKVRFEIEVLPDDPQLRAGIAETVANALAIDELRTLARIVKEQPDLIKTAKTFLKGK